MSQAIAVLSGATGGIGQAIAKRLAQRHYRLVLLGRQQQLLDSLINELPSPQCGHHIGLSVDLTMTNDINHVIDLLSGIGRCDLLINNAGVNSMQPLQTLSTTQVDNVLSVNIRAPMLLSQGLLAALSQARGTIINVGSSFGAIGYPLQSHYCASKFALRGFSEALARELSDSAITVKYFAPRATHTAINSDKVVALNTALGNAMDTPDYVADEFMRLLDSTERQRSVGKKESFFAKVNALWPTLVDNALAKQLPVIKKLMR
ncbi:SDR family oxidoreductase [Pseudoalteromonas ruthenica]|uniref:Oxidoreductase n=1 Tax=Pseudoalteromonas ruthenica TaxID=151081 RepID=A0A0F4PYW4_9GAMM|nr:SDR family oxidoreductase [Pseudoalteromonas ruthenica]KJY95818.1 oxidoreductase [Pseudoalteromonas ruthenica]KJZ00295.1 oxidoreductase [Pseudoalteromonas ruthenica]TMO86085.1 short chain dehydrogenase [Pseudoalteromonas ruthenica]TMO90752.1 short chain dehydrogenase [Pseudoalteromonas ruthenica]TMP00989.1 short chain dehydrogenase [Pseudoalteromonas ruthenica]